MLTKIGSVTGKQWKEEYISLLQETNKKDIDKLINFLENESDFFIAPASSNYHGSYEYGLLEHSLKVYENLKCLSTTFENNLTCYNIIIISLLHDICKVNFYMKDYRNKKKKDKNNQDILSNGKPIWYSEEFYNFNDTFPFGHGEKSVIMLQKFISLEEIELYCIRWHMLFFDDITKSYIGNLTLMKALEICPEIALVHSADLLSCNVKLMED